MNSPDGTVWGRIIYERESLPLGPEFSDRDLFVRVLFFEMAMRELRERILSMMAIREAIMSSKEGSKYKDDALEEYIHAMAPFIGAEKAKKHEEIAKMLEEETKKVFRVRPVATPSARRFANRRTK